MNSHQPYSTSTPATSRSTMEPGASSTDYLCITAQYHSFKQVEETIEVPLDNLEAYYKVKVCVLIPKKTQVTVFHLGNKEAKGQKTLKVVWNKTKLENTTYPKYHGVTLDRSLSYKQQMQNTKINVDTRNNLLTKLATSKWGANLSTIPETALALSYSMGEYTSPVWARSPNAKNLDLELNRACRSVAEF